MSVKIMESFHEKINEKSIHNTTTEGLNMIFFSGTPFQFIYAGQEKKSIGIGSDSISTPQMLRQIKDSPPLSVALSHSIYSTFFSPDVVIQIQPQKRNWRVTNL